jgi:hypothetical protein
MPAAVIGLGLSAANTGANIYNLTQNGAGQPFTTPAILSPQEQGFYEAQTLAAEAAANQNADAATVAANATYATSSTLSWLFWGFAAFIGFKILKRDRLL